MPKRASNLPEIQNGELNDITKENKTNVHPVENSPVAKNLESCDERDAIAKVVGV